MLSKELLDCGDESIFSRQLSVGSESLTGHGHLSPPVGAWRVTAVAMASSAVRIFPLLLVIYRTLRTDLRLAAAQIQPSLLAHLINKLAEVFVVVYLFLNPCEAADWGRLQNTGWSTLVHSHLKL